MSQTAQIVTDKWSAYQPLKKVYDIEQKLSINGKNFKELHIVIMQLQSWLRVIPKHVSKWHVQAYLDAFCIRINRSQFKQSNFHKTIERMVNVKPIYHKKILTV
jgi:hypothetical protein|tara:strand:- start:341 stop:652 length:312 start_codon:yes stop_codon:yes gene_type:complete